MPLFSSLSWIILGEGLITTLSKITAVKRGHKEASFILTSRGRFFYQEFLLADLSLMILV